MKTVLLPLLHTLCEVLCSRASLHLENLALRQQLAMVANRDCKRLRFRQSERILWVWLYRLWPGCLKTLMVFTEIVPIKKLPVAQTPISGWIVLARYNSIL